MRRTGLLVLISSIVGAPWITWSAELDDPARVRSDEVYILGKGDLLQLLEKDPEAVVLYGERAREYIENARVRDQGGLASAIVQQCEIMGELSDDQALLRLKVTVRSERDGRSPVPLSLREATPISVSIDGGPPFLTRDSMGWIAWVEGRGLHTIVIEAQLPILGSRNLPSLVCGIPEAPITSFELRATRPVSDVRLTPAVPVTIGVDESKQRITAALGPRSRLDLRWRWDSEAKHAPPPLLRASSQVTAEVEPEGIQIKTELRIQSLRGSQHTIELRNTPEERVLDVQTTDGKVIGWQATVDGAVLRILLHYTEPLTGYSELVITSDRPWTRSAGAVRGWVVQGAYSHWSQVALRAVAELDVAVTETENAQPTDTLPAALRSPRNEAAFASHAQPYRLALSIQPRRAHTTVRSNVSISYGEDSSIVNAHWQFTVHGGKVRQLEFRLPSQFSADHFVFSDVVQAVREEETSRGRVAQVYLKGTPDEFDVRLRAVVSLVAARNLVKLELPWPRDAQSELSRLYLRGTPDIDLEPTPNFVAADGVADASHVKDFAGQPASFRAFECRSLLDQVAFRLSKSAAALWHQTQVQLQLDEGSAHVLQSFDFTAQGVAPRQLRFAVPESARGSVHVELAPGSLISDTQSDELVIRLGGEPVDPLRVELSYRVPLPQLDAARVVVPLVYTTNARCVATEVSVAAPKHVYLGAAGEGWQAVTVSRQRNSKADGARWILRKSGSADSVEFNGTAVSWLPEPATTVERTWIDVVLDSQGAWRMRSRFVVMDPDPAGLRVRIPRGGRLTGVRWDGQAIPVYPGAEEDTIELRAAIPRASPVVLEMELVGVARKPIPWGSMVWDPPHVLGNVVWGKVFWQIVLPDEFRVVRGSSGYCDENSLAWRDLSLRLAARQDDASLARWLTGSTENRGIASSGQRLLYSRLLSIGPFEVTCVSRRLLTLVSSLSVMVFGCMLITLPNGGRALLVVAVLFAATFFAASEPHAASEFVRSARWGVPFAFVAGGIQMLLMRRRPSRQSVFPEPAHLAKVRGSSNRGGSDFSLVRSDLPPHSPEPAADVPRLTAPSPSVR